MHLLFSSVPILIQFFLFLSAFTIEQALQKHFLSISLQVKNIETEIQNLEKERKKIHQKLEEQIYCKTTVRT